MIRTLRIAGLGIILVIFLATLFPVPASAFEIKLGNVREQAIKLLMEQKKLSRDSAEQALRRYDRQHRTEIIDSVEIPDGVVADFVTIDATGPGRQTVEHQGCGMMFSPGSEWGRKFWSEVEKTKGTHAYEHFMKVWRAAVDRGYFIQKLTPEQLDQMKNVGRTEGQRERAFAAQEVSVLVVSPRMPYWDDRSTNASRRAHGHPINNANPGSGNNNQQGRGRGGVWSSGVMGGMNNPSWSNTGVAGPHPEINQYYTTKTDFRERWFTLVFDVTNPNSLTNFYRANSHGHIAITGDRSNIAAWVETNHICDVNTVGDIGHDYTPFPGTPIIRDIGGADRIYRASLNNDPDFSALFSTHGMGSSSAARTRLNYIFRMPGQGGDTADPPTYGDTNWFRMKSATATSDPDDDRHVTFTDITFEYRDPDPAETGMEDADDPSNDDWWEVHYCPSGWSGSFPPVPEGTLVPNGTVYTWNSSSSGYAAVGRGCGALSNTLVSGGEILQTRPFNRLKSFCYYTHDHVWTHRYSDRPYQLAHCRNENNAIDDIQGDDDHVSQHVDRPAPYDHDTIDDADLPNAGYWPNPDSTPGHTSAAWRGNISTLLTDYGIFTSNYDIVFYVHPNGSGAPTGAHTFIANGGGGQITVPETAGLGLVGHEIGHCFGFIDLYDHDFYWNGYGKVPPHYESDAMGPYSIMANGGMRVDLWHKVAPWITNGPWVTPVRLARETSPGSGIYVPEDKPNAPLPEVEGTLQNPVVYKAEPDLATGYSTGGNEYYLVENRNRNFGDYYGDRSPQGMYIYHIDQRFGQDDDAHFMVIIEQADGLYELERVGRSQTTDAMMAADPFPGSLLAREFTQWTSPDSRCHGRPTGGTVIPGSSYDSFFRADQISDPGVTMKANLWVQPRELVVTPYTTPVAPPTALQGELNVPVLGLHLDNDPNAPNISQGDVVIREIRIDESGNSNTDGDVARALVYEDVGGDGIIIPGTDVLLGTAPVANQQANFTGLSFRVILGTTRDLLLAYDVADTAQTEPAVTLGAGIDYANPHYDPAYRRSAITPQIPGAIQERVRSGGGVVGDSRFPIRSDSDKVVILEAPDTLVLTPTDVAPATAIQGTPDVPMLGLRLDVDRDTVELQSLRVDTTGTSTRPGDVSAKLYDDGNINAVLDPGEALVDEATFAQPGGPGAPILAVFDDLSGYQIDETAHRGLLVVYDFASDATVGATVNATLADATYVQLIEPDDLVASANFPMASSDTLIVINNPPILTDSLGGTTDWLSPTTGTPTTVFTWDAVYTDIENDPPAPLQVFIDGAPYDMWAVNPVDTNYTDGALFRYETTLPVGNHVYYMFVSDGATDVRFPSVAPDTYPFPIVVNTPPMLSNGSVTPMRGDDTTAFAYEITFTDPDAHMATFVEVMIDGGGGLPMTEDDINDLDTTDGKLYVMTLVPGTLTPGAHKAVFRASDGFDTVIWPPTGAMSGPIVSSDSSGFFADASYNIQVGPYEEGDPIYAQITDIDQNENVGALDTLLATVRVLTGGDLETITLIETAVDSGIFRTLPSGVPTLGRSGVSGDGVINVIAGPTGNTLLLSYTDPLDPTDSQSLVASVVDTVAPTAIAIPELSVTSDTNGSVVDVDFTAYDEAAQVDVDHYNVYYELSPAAIGGLTPRAVLTPGTQTVQIPTGGPGPDIYVAVAVYDEVPNVDTAVHWKMVSTADTEPPILVGPNPMDGATEVPLDTLIGFRVEDVGSGVDPADITVRLKQDPADGGVWKDITADVIISDTASSRRVDYDPPVDFLYNQTVSVRVIAQDIVGNGMTDEFSFSTVTDVDPPQIVNISPADGETDVPVDTDISFDLLDTPAGVDAASIHVTVEGTNVTTALQITGTPDALSVLYDPAGNFPYGTVIPVTVDAADIAGNAMPTASFSFTTLPDTEGTVIDQLDPADGATDVLIDADISFRVQDAISGVDTSTVELKIDGNPVTLTNFQHLSPTSVLVTYDPPSDFDYDKQVTARASAQDNAGNPATSVTWRFRTEPPPTYSITGTILETVPDDGSAQTTQVGVPGVAVKITKPKTGELVLTVYTAGTGVFQAMGLLDSSYLVTPELTDYTFTSAISGKSFQRVYVGTRDTDGDGNPELDASGIDFSAVRKLYSIKGRVLEGGAGLAGVQLTDGTRTAFTDANGRYSLDDVPSGAYSVTPTLTNYTFSPASRAATVASANATDIDFTATPRTFSVSGTVSDSAGARLVGVEIRAVGGTGVAVTSRAGQYTLTGVKAGIQTIVASRDGYTFEPAPGVVVENVTVDQDLTGIDFIGYPVVGRTFGAGVHFIGVPVRPRSNDAETVFGTRDVVRWDPTSVPPRYFSADSEPTAPILRVEPGAGFFVRFPQQTDLNVAGTPVSLTTPFGFVINQGWNMQANPFPTALAFANLVPNTQNGMAPYGFVLENGQYELVSNIADLGGRRWLDGWEGAWLLGSANGTTITALPPGSSPASAADEPAKRVVDRDNWQIPIVARAAGSVDACNAAGVSSRAGDLQVPNPPPIVGAVDVVLHGPAGEGLAYDLRGSLGAKATWEFSVHADARNTAVEVLLPDLSEVPADLTVTLVDVAAGETRYARTMPTYVYNSGQGGAREFVLKVEPRRSTGLTIRTAGAQVGRQGAVVTYVLSAEAKVRARVMNIAGKPIRTLTRNATASAGSNTLMWNLSSDLNTRVPNGCYLVDIEASTQDGQRASALQTIVVER